MTQPQRGRGRGRGRGRNVTNLPNGALQTTFRIEVPVSDLSEQPQRRGRHNEASNLVEAEVPLQRAVPVDAVEAQEEHSGDLSDNVLSSQPTAVESTSLANADNPFLDTRATSIPPPFPPPQIIIPAFSSPGEVFPSPSSSTASPTSPHQPRVLSN
ncbi:hypothetical protein H0H93_005274 [Arthromyces matolae]|nr:hypothetical protein H0H93_005274 [Arthromyces matolae]